MLGIALIKFSNQDYLNRFSETTWKSILIFNLLYLKNISLPTNIFLTIDKW